MSAYEPGWADLLRNLFVVFPKAQVRQRSEKLRSVTRRIRNFDRDPHVAKYQQHAARTLSQLDELFSQQSVIHRTQKLWYTASLLNILFLGIVTAHLPHILHIVYTVELSFLLPIRFYTYIRRDYQFFLADLCYYVNFLLLIYIWLWPNWTQLWIACFAFSFGTLATSVVTWRNKLVMQSIDKTTSTFIHMLPPVVCHTINFRLDPEFKQRRFPGALHMHSWQTVNSILWTTALYFIWQSLYHFFITVRCADKIKLGTTTSFTYMRKRFAKARIGIFVNSLPGPLPVCAFTAIQFGYTLITMAPCPLYYHYELLSTVYLLCIFAVAAHNGATFYIDVYGNRFREQVHQLQAELARLQDDENEESLRTSAAVALTSPPSEIAIASMVPPLPESKSDAEDDAAR